MKKLARVHVHQLVNLGWFTFCSTKQLRLYLLFGHNESFVTTILVVQIEQAIGCVCLCVCIRTIILMTFDFWQAGLP